MNQHQVWTLHKPEIQRISQILMKVKIKCRINFKLWDFYQMSFEIHSFGVDKLIAMLWRLRQNLNSPRSDWRNAVKHFVRCTNDSANSPLCSSAKKHYSLYTIIFNYPHRGQFVYSFIYYKQKSVPTPTLYYYNYLQQSLPTQHPRHHHLPIWLIWH